MSIIFKLEAAFLEHIIKSVKDLESNWNQKLLQSNITNDRELVKFQIDFWRLYVEYYDKENRETISRLDRLTQSKEKFFRNIIADFNCMVHLFEQNIMEDLKSRDYESAKLTILVAIAEIQKLRCKPILLGK